jgi:hypothetical protein
MGALCLGGKDLMISKRALLLESPVWVLCRSTQYAVCLLGYLPSLVDQSIVIVPSRNSRECPGYVQPAKYALPAHA